MKRIGMIALAALLVGATATTVRAQNPWTSTLQRWLTDMANFRGYASEGFTLNQRSISVGQFPRGIVPSGRSQFTLATGFQYVFLAKCDENCFDLSLELYDPTGRKIQESKIADGAVALAYTPQFAGTYTLSGTALRCAAQVGLYCNWGFGVLEAPFR